MKKDNALLAYTLYYPGIIAQKTRHYELAIKLVRGAINYKDNVAEFHNTLGAALRDQGKSYEASASCERALALRPKYAEALCNLSSCLRAQGRLQEAEKHCRKALEFRSQYPEAHYNLGAALLAQSQHAEAAKHFRSALALRPKYAEALNGLGVVLAEWGKAKAAITHFTRALSLDPAYAEAYYNLGCAQQAMGRINEALAQYQSALALRPAYPEACIRIGALLAGTSPDVAEAHFRRAIALRPDHAETYNWLGTILAHADRLDEAMACYERAIAINPRYDESHYNLGFVLQMQSRFVEAAARFRLALEINPGLADAQSALNDALEQCGQLDVEVDSQIRLVTENPGDTPAQAKLHHMMLKLANAGRRAKAIERTEEWLRVCPDSPLALHMLASLKQAGGENPLRAADGYVEALFDSFADQFDERLASLDYRAPQLLVEAVKRQNPGGYRDVLEIGCGTGLTGALLRPLAKNLAGVDLSQTMLDHAARRKAYDQLHKSELMAFLASRPLSYDLIAASDVLIYFGELAPVLAWIKTALRHEGVLAFTLERDAGETPPGWRLQINGRYCHSEDYVRKSLMAAGFTIISLESCVLRTEFASNVHGLIVLASSTAKKE